MNTPMKISDLILILEKIKLKEGDITVCTTESDEYWGSVQSHLSEGYNINVSPNAQPDGPKSGKMEKAVMFGA